jgi:cephalosporin hydroxylase
VFDGIYSLEGRDGSQYKNPRLPVHTAQRTWELMRLVSLYFDLQPLRVLEIGTEIGGTLWHWLQNAIPGSVVVSVDDMASLNGEQREKLPGMWQSWCPQGVRFEKITGDSKDPQIIAKVKELLLQVDFLFIDGDHTYEGVRADWMNYGPMVRRGGLIAFHDLITPDFGKHVKVPQLWKEIQDAGYITMNLFADPSENWGGIGVVVR